ncbi:MAG: nuclear transport factor 2 family protein [Acidobacteria bacterium]|nr:nuclear transport factor 2 family protein [Acidobacteriota bacterium]
MPVGAGCDRSRADTDAIRALVAREVAAINARDVRTLSEIWSQDNHALLFDVPPPGRFEGWEQIQRQWTVFFDRASEIQLTVGALRAEAEGPLGYATYDWAMTGRIGSYVLDDRGQATAIYRREKRGWRLVHAHYSPIPPAPAARGPADGSAGPASGAGRPAGAAATPGGGKERS